jgi:uncharacterized protein (TIGR03437 family)
MTACRLIIAALLCSAKLFPATFGTVVPLVGGASDIVLDEARNRLYLVSSSQNRIEVYSIAQRRFLSPVSTDALPLGAAISPGGEFLYVASFDGSALNIIDLNTLQTSARVSLPAKPEGIAVGGDGRVLISTIGTGANNAGNVLLVFDPQASSTSALTSVQLSPPAPASPLLPAPSGRVFLASRSQLVASKNGDYIVGVNLPNANARSVFVYEVGSGTVLRSRTVTSASSVLSIAPDSSKFMAGLQLFDLRTLQVLAQQNIANSPYPFTQGANFNTQQTQGGSVFAPDGSTLYSAFNIAPVQNPPARPNVSQLMLSDPENLLIRLGLQLPENLAGKMVISGDGGNVYALSESGFMVLPISTIAQSPVANPARNVSLLVYDQCSVFAQQRTTSIAVRNEGRGRITATAQLLQIGGAVPPGLGGVGGPGGGLPGGVIVLPGAQAPAATAANAPTVRTQNSADGTSLDFGFTASAAARAPGTVPQGHTFLVQSNEAINIPAAVRVFQNSRDSESRGDVIPIQVGLSIAEALEDMVMDQTRQRLYIANSGMNRVEVFDTRSRQLLNPIKVGQLPRSLAMTPDGSTLYVANTGGEDITVIDLNKLAVSGRVVFPALPFNSAAIMMTPSVLAAGLRGVQVIMNNGTVWKIVGNEAVPRNLSPIIGSMTIPAPRTIAATPNGEYMILLAGNGFVYLYDSLTDEFVQGRQIFTAPITGFYGPVAAGPRGQYYLANGTILNQSLTPIGSSGTVVNPGPVRPGVDPGTSTRPVSAVAIAAGNTFARFAQPVRANATAVPVDSPSIEIVDASTGSTMRTAPALEGPLATLIGAARLNVNGRTLAVDAAGSAAYALTTSGLTIIPLDQPDLRERPAINPGGAVSLSSYLPAFSPGSLISVFGRNLGGSQAFSTTPLPTAMGGTCVTLNNQALPLLMTSTGQINAQIPHELAPGRYPLVVRSVDKKMAAVAQTITIARHAPAIFADPETRAAAVFHADGRAVTRDHPAKRDEPLVMYATGLGATKGGRVTSGSPAPSEPLAIVENLEVFFGDPRYRQAEVIVDWAGLTPGYIGLYQINLRVPGDHMRGGDLPVTLRIGGVESQKSGPVVPVIAVD